MVASGETLQDIAAERQLQPATLERVIRLIDILDAFGADTRIGPRIALKSGCVQGLLLGSGPRFSGYRAPDAHVNPYPAAVK
jgi:hypothetical protein